MTQRLFSLLLVCALMLALTPALAAQDGAGQWAAFNEAVSAEPRLILPDGSAQARLVDTAAFEGLINQLFGQGHDLRAQSLGFAWGETADAGQALPGGGLLLTAGTEWARRSVILVRMIGRTSEPETPALAQGEERLPLALAKWESIGEDILAITTERPIAPGLLTISLQGGELGVTIPDACELSGHQFGQWKIIEEASCEHGSRQSSSCLNCGEINYRRANDKTPHEWALVEFLNPGCSADGFSKYKCSVCGEERTDIHPATGPFPGACPPEQP